MALSPLNCIARHARASPSRVLARRALEDAERLNHGHDFPPEISGPDHSEQYLLACWTPAGSRVDPALPAAHVNGRADLQSVVVSVWSTPKLTAVEQHGFSFWGMLRRREPVTTRRRSA